MDTRDGPAPGDPELAEQHDCAALVGRLTTELELLRARVGRVERDLAATRPLVDAVAGLDIWDFTPYGVTPGSDWVAIDRTAAAELLAALAAVDHWQPWSTPIEARPQP